MASLTPRGKALRHLSTHRGIKEDPPGSNTDSRKWGIRRAQRNCAGGGAWLIGTPWCGEWAFWALQHAGVKGISSRLASVSLIEDDARAHRAPFFGWAAPSEWRQVLRGDLVVLFGRGVHVETVRAFVQSGGQVFVVTDGGNTSSGSSGSQSNGGMSARRVRPLSDVHGFAKVDYPGGKVRGMATRALMAFEAAGVEPEPRSRAQERDMPQSDRLLIEQLRAVDHPDAADLAAVIRGAM